MSTPGRLAASFPLEPLARVSPSSYSSLLKCWLREVWARGHARELLPASPAARLGRVIHRLLEAAERGQLNPVSRADLERRFEELVKEEENEMETSWLSSHLVPLRSHLRGFEVRVRRAINTGIQISHERVPPADGGRRPPGARYEFEVWVHSRSGLVGGYIDRIATIGPDIILSDFKSGYVTGMSSTGPEAQLLKKYTLQLKLYAGLYEATFGRWPTRLELIPIGGRPLEVTFSQRECGALISEAEAELCRLNEAVVRFVHDPARGQKELARPAPETCRFCPFRPACVPYRLARRVNGGGENWSADVWGRVSDVVKQGDGRLTLALTGEDPAAGEVRVRGLSSDRRRHPALHGLGRGDQVALYNLARTASPRQLTETSMTVCYREDEER